MEEDFENDKLNNEIEHEKEKRKKLKKIVLIELLLIGFGFVFMVICIYIYSANSNSIDKPLIYIYPEKEIDVSVKLGNEERLTCTYPKYENSWEVKASPNGDLEDLKTGRKLYSLYWEGKYTARFENKPGFVIKGEDTAKFLEEKLEILGLNQREAEEFIVYWLPQLEENKYNYIRFQTMEEIEDNMPLEVNPVPDTLIRIVMEWKGLDKPIKIEEQKLEKTERKGYTAVEWGGTKLK